MSAILMEFTEKIKAIYAGNLKSIVLYGSKASGEDTKKHSDYNLLIVLENISFHHLKLLGKIMKKWVKRGNRPPLLFTEERLKKSADVFPIEFFDIKDNHKILYGIDYFEKLEIRNTHLRHECESELKGKLIKLRQGYMVSRGKSDVQNLLIDSISTFLIIFRHVIRLFGITPSLKRLDALKVLSDKTGMRPSVFITIFNMKRGDKEALKQDPDLLMEEYLKEIERITDVVDNL